MRHPTTALGQAVRQGRQRLGLAQYELADELGINKKTLNDIEVGHTANPRWDVVRLLAQALQLSLDSLVRAPDPQRPAPLTAAALNRALVQALPEVAWQAMPATPQADDGAPALTHQGMVVLPGLGALRCYRLNSGDIVFPMEEVRELLRVESVG
jgi:transcriptional regulator with XRE-family HTH domain